MRPARVLIVEDEAIVAMDLEHRLRTLGHAVVGSANTAALAVQRANEHRPDLVLMARLNCACLK
jgi:AmiR/NasT family two-component response regulator